MCYAGAINSNLLMKWETIISIVNYTVESVSLTSIEKIYPGKAKL